MNCPAAPRLEATVPDTSSTYAEEGTLAHAYCARKLKERFGCSTLQEDAEIDKLAGAYHTGEMDEYTDTYAEIVLGKYTEALKVTPDARILIETVLSFGDYVPGSFGTADAIIVADGLMEVIDFKYGKGVKVSATVNPQMMIYALGAYLRFSAEYDIRRVRITIVQPRIANLSEYELDVNTLLLWAENNLKPAAALTSSDDAPQKPGDWCRFCKVKSCCRALADKALATQKAHSYVTPGLLTPQKMASDVLPWLPVIKTWISEVEEFALNQALGGVSYPGYKLVEGRSVRRIADPEAVKAVLAKEGYKESEYLKPAALCGIGELEKLVGKKAFTALCSEFITKPAGKPTLVTDDDKRPAYNAALADFKDIKV